LIDIIPKKWFDIIYESDGLKKLSIVSISLKWCKQWNNVGVTNSENIGKSDKAEPDKMACRRVAISKFANRKLTFYK